MRRKKNNKLVGIYLWKLILIIIAIFVVFISVECFFLIERTVKKFVAGFAEEYNSSTAADLSENTITNEEGEKTDTTNDSDSNSSAAHPASNDVGTTDEPSPVIDPVTYCGQTHTHKNVCYQDIPQTDILTIYNLIDDIISLPSYNPTVLNNLKSYTTDYDKFSSDSAYNNYKNYLDNNCSKIEAANNIMNGINSSYYTYIDNRQKLLDLHSVLTFRKIFDMLNTIPRRSEINNKMTELKNTQDSTGCITYLTEVSNAVTQAYQSFTSILSSIDSSWYQYIINYENMSEQKEMSDNLPKITVCTNAIKDLPKWEDVAKQIETNKTDKATYMSYLQNLSTVINQAEATFTSQNLDSKYYTYVIKYDNYKNLLNVHKILKCAQIIDNLPEYENVTQNIKDFKTNNQVDDCITYLSGISSEINEAYSQVTAENLNSTYNKYIINYEKYTQLYDMHFSEISDFTNQIKLLPTCEQITNKLNIFKENNDISGYINYLKNEIILSKYENVYNNLVNSKTLTQTHYTYIINYDNLKDLHNLQLVRTLEIIEKIYELEQLEEINYSDAKIRTQIISTSQLCKKLIIENQKIIDYIINYEFLAEIEKNLNDKDTSMKLTVQYYAYINIVDDIDEEYKTSTVLPLINTTGKKMPQNTLTQNLKEMYLDSNGDVIYQKKLSEVYRAHTYEFDRYFTDLSIDNMLMFTAFYDRLTTNYELSEIWILHSGCDPNSTNPDDFTSIPYESSIYFTRDPSINTDFNRIRLYENSTIRFVYNTKVIDDVTLDVEVYDYDITDGYIYDSKANAKNHTETGRLPTSKQGNTATRFAYTGAAGINSIENYGNKDGAKLAFGNQNTGVNWRTNTWKSNSINRYNRASNGGIETYKGCTFGIVTGLINGKLEYADGIAAPNLFNEGDAIGKTSYTNGEYKFKFNRTGDRYILTEVVGTAFAKNLQKFTNPCSKYTTIWTNNFWPLDDADSYGTDTHDLKFGSENIASKRQFVGVDLGDSQKYGAAESTFPPADSLTDHNSYFGIRGEFSFNLSPEYTGPLEWHFYGDDDLWIFLDDKLIIDIGGVHSSVGEYANFWDYLQKGSSGEHKVTFFFTERGSSGSTCWMRFALPEINEAKEDPTNGNLRLEKEVIGSDTKEEFHFIVTLKDQDNQELNKYFHYNRYDSNGNVIKENILKSGGIVRFNKDEYIIIENVPGDITYSVEEVENSDYIVQSENSNGNIIAGQTVTAKFINTYGTKSVKAIKQWDDNNSTENRPQEIQVKLTPKFVNEETGGEEIVDPGGEEAGGEEVDGETGSNESAENNTCEEYFNQYYPSIELVVSLNEDNNWNYEWPTLPKYRPVYDSTGKNIIEKQEIEYTVKEIYTTELSEMYYPLPVYQNINEDFVLTNVLYRNIEVTKVDADDESIKLGGAEFKLQKMKQDGENWVVDPDEKPMYGVTSTEGENIGKVTFSKLTYGTYLLTEEKAPNGYNLNKGTRTITINEDNLLTTGITFIDKKGAVLPFTGGAGINLFVISGLAIIILTILKIRKKELVNYQNSKPKRRRRRKPIK